MSDTNSDNNNSKKSDDDVVIPVIRLDDPNPESMIQELRKACTDVGFFYLQGHGLSNDLIDSVFTQSKALFDLPLEDKQALSDPILSRGYTAMQEETLDTKVQTQGDTKEGFYIGREVSKDDPTYNPAKLQGPNQWPTTQQLPDFRPVMEDYMQQASATGLRLVQCLAKAIGLDDEHYFDKDFERPMAVIRLLHYAPTPSQPQQGIFGCGAHSDYGMLTLLLTDATPGLQIFHKNAWIDVPPRPNTFVVNLGDMLERWTNGIFKSTLHRVVIPDRSGADRYSIPFFYEPNFDCWVECLPVCQSEDRPAKYPPITSGQHLLQKYQETHADFQHEQEEA